MVSPSVSRVPGGLGRQHPRRRLSAGRGRFASASSRSGSATGRAFTARSARPHAPPGTCRRGSSGRPAAAKAGCRAIEERHHQVVERVRRRDRRLAVVTFGEADLRGRVGRSADRSGPRFEKPDAATPVPASFFPGSTTVAVDRCGSAQHARASAALTFWPLGAACSSRPGCTSHARCRPGLALPPHFPLFPT